MQDSILVVDDEQPVQRLLRLVFEEDGFRVRCADDGREALERVHEEIPSAIVLDLSMPVMDGRAFYTALRDQGYVMPVVLLSAHGARSARRELGADGAVNKPFDSEVLLALLRRLVPRA